MMVRGEAFDARTSCLDDVGEQCGGMLLSLEMTSLDNQQLGMTEPGVVMHLACKVRIDAKRLGLGDEVGARAGAESESLEE